MMQLLAIWCTLATVAGSKVNNYASFSRTEPKSKQNGMQAIESTATPSLDALLTRKAKCGPSSQWNPQFGACVCKPDSIASGDGIKCIRGTPQNQFAGADTDGSGSISKSEFAGWAPAKGSSFEHADLDGNGDISRAEFLGSKGLECVLPEDPVWIDAVKVAATIAPRNLKRADSLLVAASKSPTVRKRPLILQSILMLRALSTSTDTRNLRSLFGRIAKLDANDANIHSGNIAPISVLLGYDGDQVRPDVKRVLERLDADGFLPMYQRGHASCVAAEIELSTFKDLKPEVRFLPKRLNPVLQCVSPMAANSRLQLLFRCPGASKPDDGICFCTAGISKHATRTGSLSVRPPCRRG